MVSEIIPEAELTGCSRPSELLPTARVRARVFDTCAVVRALMSDDVSLRRGRARANERGEEGKTTTQEVSEKARKVKRGSRRD